MAVRTPSVSPAQYLFRIKDLYGKAGDPERAEGQMRYMRNQFAYYGIKAPEWVAILRDEFKEYGQYQGELLKEFVRLCFDDEYREIHYCGLQMLEKRIKTLHAADINFLEECVTNQSWWDSVDWINKLVGIHFRRYPGLQKPACEKWVKSGNRWLQRLTMIHQLAYKNDTDFDLMKDMILRLKGSDEFFIQKGAGWALRQYSKFNAKEVIAFIDANPDLASLTKREGLKWLKKQGVI